MYYRVFGNGHPVVFLHGFLEDHSIWIELAERLNDYTIIIPDLPGHGKSSCLSKNCSMAFMAEIVSVLLNKLNIQRPLVFGHSMGGYAGLELARLQLIDLVLVHSNFWADSPQKKADRNRVIEVVEQSHLFFIKQAIPNLFSEANIAKK